MMASRPNVRRVLTDFEDMAPYLSDWRREVSGTAPLVVLPESVEEVVETVHWCRANGLSMVPQGGNTSLMGGSVPSAGSQSVVLSLKGLDRVRSIDPESNVAVFEAGVVLQNAQAAAAEVGRLFPLSLAAEGSCTVGGNLSTNAGGTAVLQYGNARELCLGLEVVTADGEVLSNLRGLRKDNTGLDLRHLFIGAEGTLGIITAAAMRLFPMPVAKITSYAAMVSPHDALSLLRLAQEMLGSGLTAFELMSAHCVDTILRRFPAVARPFRETPPFQVLLELSDQESEAHAHDRFMALMEKASEKGLITDAVVASTLAQSAAFWALRERAAEAQMPNFKHDISLPISKIPAFLEASRQRILRAHPGCELYVVGHMGDGNLHFNVDPPPGLSEAQFEEVRSGVERIVFELVESCAGSISAEHGIGRHKIRALQQYKPKAALNMMRTVKRALDPSNMMNPGVIFEAPNSDVHRH